MQICFIIVLNCTMRERSLSLAEQLINHILSVLMFAPADGAASGCAKVKNVKCCSAEVKYILMHRTRRAHPAARYSNWAIIQTYARAV